jgi:hypothetical protein
MFKLRSKQKYICDPKRDMTPLYGGLSAFFATVAIGIAVTPPHHIERAVEAMFGDPDKTHTITISEPEKFQDTIIELAVGAMYGAPDKTYTITISEPETSQDTPIVEP